MTSVRVLITLLLTAATLFAGPIKLFLKDGTYHLVREYQVQGDRVHYYSIERNDWEDVPVALTDLGKTESERTSRNNESRKEAQQADEEEKFERAQRKELASIPMNSGAYYKEGDQMRSLAIADYKVVTDKKRSVLKVLSPIPIIPGHATVQIQGEHSKFLIHEDRPEFYIRLEKEERFGIIKLASKKSVRIVENISVVPVSKENVEEQNQIATFEQQMSEGLFKIWPERTLEPGEYALVEYTEGEVELMVWDFADSK